MDEFGDHLQRLWLLWSILSSKAEHWDAALRTEMVALLEPISRTQNPLLRPQLAEMLILSTDRLTREENLSGNESLRLTALQQINNSNLREENLSGNESLRQFLRRVFDELDDALAGDATFIFEGQRVNFQTATAAPREVAEVAAAPPWEVANDATGMHAFLLKDAQRGNSYPLSSQRSLVLGREEDCDIVIDEKLYNGVSRHHAKLQPAGNGWQICDLNSTNGTYVNRRRIQGCQQLRNGDRIQLDQYGPTFIFEDQGGNVQPIW
jgi:hypothetical protein